MEEKEFYRRMRSIQDEVLRLNNAVMALGAYHLRKFPENFWEFSMDTAVRAERVACVDSGHDYIPSEQALIRALYSGAAPQEIDLPMQAYCSKNRGNVTQAIAQLYLNREVMLQ